MKKLAAIVVVFALGVGVGPFVTPDILQAQQPGQLGTAAEAKPMLEKAVVAVKADKAKALAMFNNGEGGFKDRDLIHSASTSETGRSTQPKLRTSSARMYELSRTRLARRLAKKCTRW